MSIVLWMSSGSPCGQPDPAGSRLAILRHALQQLMYIEAVFWDFASLYQAPRTAEQQATFSRAPRLLRPAVQLAPPYAALCGGPCE